MTVKWIKATVLVAVMVALGFAISTFQVPYLARVDRYLSMKGENVGAAHLDAIRGTLSDLLSANDEQSFAELPRLVVSGGTKAQRALVTARLDHYRIKVPRGTTLEIVEALGPGFAGQAMMGRACTEDSARWWPDHRKCTAISVLESVVSEGGIDLDRVLIHEVGHAAQFGAAKNDLDEVAYSSLQSWPTETPEDGVELEADCLVQVEVGAKTARLNGSYLQRWDKTCSAAQLKDARAIWASVR